MLIGDNVVASIHYTLTNNAGEVLDSSEGAAPLNYLHGAGNIIPGLENALTGKAVGSSLQVTIAPAEGYGEVMEQLIDTVPMAAFQGVESVEPGMAFEARQADGSARRIVVTRVEGDQVTVDANHPLAGVELNFDVEVVAVRAATDEEIQHGHAH
ncbi:FKBP-type peptidyl-prolyl cis-trans isomerase [Haliea sp. E17]|uniref:FKBP-type peptidyl-prolyl cis-trans isomerase n=1 Tax=Haliea sp. E17 TaxID=3401576 RepID=UPI003AAB9455